LNPTLTGPSPRPDLTADLGLLVVATIWGINFSVMKAVLAVIDPLALNALRFPMAALALTLLIPRGLALPERADIPRIVALGLVGNVAYQLCFVFGLDWTLAGNASLLLATTPVWTLLISASTGAESAAPRVVAGAFTTLAGMALVVVGGRDGLGLDSATVRGDALMVVAAILWSLYTVGGRSLIWRYGPLRVTAWTIWTGTPLLVALGLPAVARTELSAVTWPVWTGVVYAGLLSIGVAYVLWYRGVQRLGNNRTAVYSNLVPVMAILTAWLWLGERPAPVQIGGAAVILTGLTLARQGQVPGPISLRWRSSGNS
jgi:drug/metabolite transporter (DMT)-like permease